MIQGHFLESIESSEQIEEKALRQSVAYLKQVLEEEPKLSIYG